MCFAPCPVKSDVIEYYKSHNILILALSKVNVNKSFTTLSVTMAASKAAVHSLSDNLFVATLGSESVTGQ